MQPRNISVIPVAFSINYIISDTPLNAMLQRPHYAFPIFWQTGCVMTNPSNCEWICFPPHGPSLIIQLSALMGLCWSGHLLFGLLGQPGHYMSFNSNTSYFITCLLVWNTPKGFIFLANRDCDDQLLNFKLSKMGVLEKDPLIQDWVFRLGSRTYQLLGQWYTILMVWVWCPQVTLVKPRYSNP